MCSVASALGGPAPENGTLCRGDGGREGATAAEGRSCCLFSQERRQEDADRGRHGSPQAVAAVAERLRHLLLVLDDEDAHIERV